LVDFHRQRLTSTFGGCGQQEAQQFWLIFIDDAWLLLLAFGVTAILVDFQQPLFTVHLASTFCL
jgi:hypothetical protein